jgi:hypothetical protein
VTFGGLLIYSPSFSFGMGLDDEGRIIFSTGQDKQCAIKDLPLGQGSCFSGIFCLTHITV